MLLKDKVIIVSGVGPGMGQAMAKIAAKEGAKVGLGIRPGDGQHFRAVRGLEGRRGVPSRS